jgi:hypothetical protein
MDNQHPQYYYHQGEMADPEDPYSPNNQSVGVMYPISQQLQPQDHQQQQLPSADQQQHPESYVEVEHPMQSVAHSGGYTPSQ